MHFAGKFHFFFKTITDSVRLGVVYLNLVFSTANGVMCCEIYLQSVAHITTIHKLFIYFFFLKVILDPRFSITDPRSWFSSKPGSFTHCDYSFFFDHWRDHLFQSNQRFQAREFVDRPVPDKLDMGFLCSARGVASRVRDSQVQSYRYKHIRDTYVTLGWISTVPLLAPHINARKF